MQELGPCITFMKIMTDRSQGTDGKGNHLAEADMQEVYRLRRIQGYLEGQAGQLEQLTVRNGSQPV